MRNSFLSEYEKLGITNIILFVGIQNILEICWIIFYKFTYTNKIRMFLISIFLFYILKTIINMFGKRERYNLIHIIAVCDIIYDNTFWVCTFKSVINIVKCETKFIYVIMFVILFIIQFKLLVHHSFDWNKMFTFIACHTWNK